MKRVMCLLLTISCCLALAACGTAAPSASNAAGNTGPAPGPSAEASFPPEYLTMKAAVETAEELVSECADLAPAGTKVWRYTYGEILCEDLQTGQTVASLPAAELLQNGESIETRYIASWTEDSVLLVLVTSGGAGKHIELAELGLKDGDICVLDRHSADEKLGFLFEERGDWREIDMVSNGKRLFIAALDSEFVFHLYLYTPASDELAALGERSLEVTIAAVPYGADMLVAGSNLEDESILELTCISLKDGSTQLLEAVPVDSAVEVFNFAFREDENLLLYTCNNTVYAHTVRSGEAPRAIGALPAVPAFFRLGATVGGRYVCHGETGQLLSCDIHGELTVQGLRILSAGGDETLAAAVRDFGVQNPQYTASVVMSDSEESLLERIQNGSENYDAFVLDLDSDAYRMLCDAGRAAPLSGSGLVDAVADSMPQRMRAALEGDGGLNAFPIRVDNYCQLLNVPAAVELSGISREKLPTDWAGFLKLLGQLAKKGALTNNGEYAVFNAEVSAGEFRDIIFSWLMQDCFLWVSADGSRVGKVEKTLLPILKEFNRVDWTGLGLPDYWEGEGLPYGGFDSEMVDKTGGTDLSVMNVYDPAAGAADGGAARKTGTPGAQTGYLRTALLTEAYLEIAVIAGEDGDEYWPLSLEPGGERLVAQNMLVFCVSADTPNREAVRAFVEYLWAKMDMTMRMTLCRNINDPVVNTHFEEDLAYYEKMIADLEKKALLEKNPPEKEMLNLQLRQMRAFVDRYRKNAYWSASAESIAAYRSLQDQLIPSPTMLWTDPSIDDAMYDFLDGALTPKQFAKSLQALMTP